jgi:hypothetical protein
MGTANADATPVRDAFKIYTGARGSDVWLTLGDNAYVNGTDPKFQAAVFDTYPKLVSPPARTAHDDPTAFRTFYYYVLGDSGPGSGSGGGERPTPKVRFGVRRGRHEGRRAGMGALSVQPHPVRDDCNHSGQSDPGPLGARALGDPHAPSLQGRPPLHPG